MLRTLGIGITGSLKLLGAHAFSVLFAPAQLQFLLLLLVALEPLSTSLSLFVMTLPLLVSLLAFSRVQLAYLPRLLGMHTRFKVRPDRLVSQARLISRPVRRVNPVQA